MRRVLERQMDYLTKALKDVKISSSGEIYCGSAGFEVIKEEQDFEETGKLVVALQKLA